MASGPGTHLEDIAGVLVKVQEVNGRGRGEHSG